MISQEEQPGFKHFSDKIGYYIGEEMVQNIETQYQKTLDFLPDLAVFIASYIVKKTFKRYTTPPAHIDRSIRFFFHNVFDPDEGAKRGHKGVSSVYLPYVRIFPSALPHTSVFKKGTYVKVISVFISATYLESFLGNDAALFPFLFAAEGNFVLEEIMTDDIIRTVNDIVKKEPLPALNNYYYKLKILELLFYLFQSLSKRQRSSHQKLSVRDIDAVYKVRERLVMSLEKSPTVSDLKQIAGMNELKMRRLFTQVFGQGIYDYYQHMRMQEAARLLREEKLSVSETGYRLGFENLSHFSRVFEKHIGKKPKQYSQLLGR